MLTPNALSLLVKLVEEKPEAGLIGACLLNLDGSFQASYTPFPTLQQEFLKLTGLGRMLFGRFYPSRGSEDHLGPQRVDYVEGACMLVRRKAYENTGGLDESYFMYSEDVEICYQMKENGWSVWYQPASKIIHVGGASSKYLRPKREADLYCGRIQFFRRHYGNLAADILKIMVIIFTAIKILFHGFLRFISGGRYGRPVVSLDYLIPALRKV
jgi:N-acetylglucosaminyl-diphospho-decaprenol L-rhamnosyltransferase